LKSAKGFDTADWIMIQLSGFSTASRAAAHGGSSCTITGWLRLREAPDQNRAPRAGSSQ